MSKLKCPACGDIVTDAELDERCENGGMPYCYCKYSAVDPATGEVWYPREFVPYERISEN